MELVEWLAHANGPSVAAGIAVAVGLGGIVYFFAQSQFDRYADFLELAGAGSDGDSDADCRANLNTDRSTHPAHRAYEARQRPIFGPDGVGGTGRHAADSDPVFPAPQAVA